MTRQWVQAARSTITVLSGYLRSIAAGADNLVVFIGPDASGKSTLTHEIARRSGGAVPMYAMQKAPLQGGILNRRFLGLNRRLRSEMLARPAGVRRKALAVITHSMEYLEQHVRLARILARSPGLVVTDGYVWGPVIRWRPGATAMPYAGVVLTAWLFPTPRMVVLCGGDPRTIESRRPDMTPVQIRKTGRMYRALLRGRSIPHMEIDTTAFTVDEAVDRIMEALGTGLAGANQRSVREPTVARHPSIMGAR